jgi:hypothetical protein
MLFLTTKPHRYQGKLRKPGDQYEIPGKTVPTLYKALGWVIDAPPKIDPVAPVRTYSYSQGYEVDGVKATDPQPAKPKRQYTRRNLTAE